MRKRKIKNVDWKMNGQDERDEKRDKNGWMKREKRWWIRKMEMKRENTDKGEKQEEKNDTNDGKTEGKRKRETEREWKKSKRWWRRGRKEERKDKMKIEKIRDGDDEGRRWGGGD